MEYLQALSKSSEMQTAIIDKKPVSKEEALHFAIKQQCYFDHVIDFVGSWPKRTAFSDINAKKTFLVRMGLGNTDRKPLMSVPKCVHPSIHPSRPLSITIFRQLTDASATEAAAALGSVRAGRRLGIENPTPGCTGRALRHGQAQLIRTACAGSRAQSFRPVQTRSMRNLKRTLEDRDSDLPAFRVFT